VIHEFRNPLPVVTPKGDGYAIYVRDGGTWENDVFAVVLCRGGQILHFTSSQIRVWKNGTFGITVDSNIQGDKLEP
jgi:hypothetical protein